MARIQHWTLLALLGLTLVMAGCSGDDDGDDSGGGQVDMDNDDDDGGEAEARGSPGWGLMGSLAALVAGLVVLKRRKK